MQRLSCSPPSPGLLRGCLGQLLASKAEKYSLSYGFTELRGRPAGRGGCSHRSPNQNVAGMKIDSISLPVSVAVDFVCIGEPVWPSASPCSSPPASVPSVGHPPSPASLRAKWWATKGGACDGSGACHTNRHASETYFLEWECNLSGSYI